TPMPAQTPSPFDTPAYRRSRRAYVAECLFEYFVSMIVGGVFLAKLLTSIGMSDAMTGIISSFVSLAFVIQLFSVFVEQRVVNTKRFAMIFYMASRLLFCSLYLIPFLPFAAGHKQVLTVVCILLAYFGYYFVSTILYKWCYSFVAPDHRARYSANKERISLLSGIVVSLGLGYVIDAFDAADNLSGGFFFAAIAIFSFAVCDLVCLLLIQKENVAPRTKENTPGIKDVFRHTLCNRGFVCVLILSALYNTALLTTSSFMGTYYISELAYTVAQVQILTTVGHLLRFFVSSAFGKYSDKRSFAKGVELALIILTVGVASVVFSTPETRLLVIVFLLLYNVALAGINQNMMNIIYSYVDSRYFVQASALKNSVGGLCGFGATLLASRLLSFVQANGNTFLGLHVYGQQVLATISCLLFVVTILFTRLVIGKQHVMKQ
ncbi:MAG: MFS transporter, partial [Clostridia bacterium]|nr:MFS transporter [Clostridia bacterium]